MSARTWLAALLSPRTAGMREDTPRLNPIAFGLMLGFILLHAIAYYRWGFLQEKHWMVVHVAIGWGVCLGIYAAFHGWAAVRRIGRTTWAVLGIGFMCVLAYWYFGRSDSYRQLFGQPPGDHETFWPLVPFMYFAVMGVVLRIVVPFVFARFVLKKGLPDFGMPWRRTARADAVPGMKWVYLGLFVAMVPILVIASHGADFMQKYPMGDIIDPNGGIWIAHLLVHEAFYFLVFLSGESFWRGFITFGTEKDLGLYGLAFMAVLYVCGHFGKPFAETLGAVAAGCALGFLALRHRSVWWGIALHFSIALSMDLLSIANNGYIVHGGG